jgi:hypothetical protein
MFELPIPAPRFPRMEPRSSRVELRLGLALLEETDRERARLAADEVDVLVALGGRARRERRVALLELQRTSETDEAPARVISITDEDVETIAARLHRSPVTVQRQLAQARLLRSALPVTLAALREGTLTPAHVDAIARTASDLPAERLDRFEADVVARAGALTPGQAATLARRVRARVDRRGEEARREDARRHEDVRVWAEADGLACLMARLPIADAARLHEAINARAREVEAPCDATLGQRRARALVEAVCGSGEGAVTAEVLVSVDLATLAGLGNASALVALGSGSPEPITAEALQEFLADPTLPVTLRRLVTAPLTGDLIDRGREAYRVSDGLRAFLVARDGTCRFPGCTRAAARCDVDHAVAWGDGGATDRSNLGPLCRRHHVLKTHGGWRIEATRSDGSVVWGGPDGQRYAFHPFPLVAEPDPEPPPRRMAEVPPPF